MIDQYIVLLTKDVNGVITDIVKSFYLKNGTLFRGVDLGISGDLTNVSSIKYKNLTYTKDEGNLLIESVYKIAKANNSSAQPELEE